MGRPTARQYGAARSTWTALGSETPVQERLDKAVEAAIAQRSDDAIGWPGVVLVLGIVAAMVLIVWLAVR